MGVEVVQEQTTYCVEYNDKEYTVISTTTHFNDHTDHIVYLDGEEVEPSIADEVITYLGDSLGG